MSPELSGETLLRCRNKGCASPHLVPSKRENSPDALYEPPAFLTLVVQPWAGISADDLKTWAGSSRTLTFLRIIWVTVAGLLLDFREDRFPGALIRFPLKERQS